MEKLATEFKVQNRTLKQIKRKGDVALYELYGANGMLYGFELIIIKIRKAREAFGKFYPEHETYPASEDWGSLGWSYGQNFRSTAVKAFETLAAERLHCPHVDDLVA
jgi:hypothetical protein